jgi:hypothetical protein
MIAHMKSPPPSATPPHDEPEAPSEQKETEPYEPLLKAVAEWFDSLEHYWSARTDLVRLRIRKAIFAGALAAAGVAAMFIVLAVSIWLLVAGIAGGLTEALGGRSWAGNLATGLLVPGLIGGWLLIRSRRQTTADLQRQQARYENRRATSRPTAESAAMPHHEN